MSSLVCKKGLDSTALQVYLIYKFKSLSHVAGGLGLKSQAIAH